MNPRAWLWCAAWGPALVWAGLIFWGSSQPVPPEVQGLPTGTDKIIHAVEYGILSYLLARGFRRTVPGWPAGRIAAAAILISGLYGALDEFHQSFVPTRTADPTDVVADLAGAATVGLALTFW